MNQFCPVFHGYDFSVFSEVFSLSSLSAKFRTKYGYAGASMVVSSADVWLYHTLLYLAKVLNENLKKREMYW